MSDETMAASADISTDIALQSAIAAGSLVKRRGRKPAQFWVSFTALDEPYKVLSAPCRHCLSTVNYHKKWEQAKSHLMRCEAFLKYVQTLSASERPQWFVVELEKRRRSSSKLLPLNLLRGEEAKSDNGAVPSTSKQSANGKSKKTKPQPTSELLVLQAMRTGAKTLDVELVQYTLSHESGGRIGEGMRELVDRAYEHVQQAVTLRLSSVLQAKLAALVLVWDEQTSSVSYWVAAQETSFLLETRDVPEQDVQDPVEWVGRDAVRVAQLLNEAVCHVVVDAPLEWTQQLKEKQLEEPKLHFHPSPRRVMETMVRELLETGDQDTGGPLEGWLAHGVACQDVLVLAGLHGKRLDPGYEWADNASRIVSGTTRSISLSDGLHAVINAERFLDVDSFRDSLVKLNSLDEASIKRVCDIVSNAVFTAKLKQFLAVIKPIFKALGELSKLLVQASDVLVAFAAMKGSLKDDPLLSSTHRERVFKVVDKYAHEFYAAEYMLPHLLDPAYLGEYLEDEAKRKAEHELLLRAGETDEQRQALYSEYTEFQIASVEQRVHADGFVYRMLKERKKTLLQFWMTDGYRWPRLQAVVLKLEKVPADANQPRPAPDDETSGLCDASKIAYMRMNAPRLSVPELLERAPLQSRAAVEIHSSATTSPRISDQDSSATM